MPEAEVSKASAMMAKVNEAWEKIGKRFLNAIAARDFWSTEGGICGMPEKKYVAELQTKLRRIRLRKGWSAEFKFWNPAKDRVIAFGRFRI